VVSERAGAVPHWAPRPTHPCWLSVGVRPTSSIDPDSRAPDRREDKVEGLKRWESPTSTSVHSRAVERARQLCPGEAHRAPVRQRPAGQPRPANPRLRRPGSTGIGSNRLSVGDPVGKPILYRVTRPRSPAGLGSPHFQRVGGVRLVGRGTLGEWRRLRKVHVQPREQFPYAFEQFPYAFKSAPSAAPAPPLRAAASGRPRGGANDQRRDPAPRSSFSRPSVADRSATTSGGRRSLPAPADSQLEPVAAIAVFARSAISSGGTSSTCVAMFHTCPNGSVIVPKRSPQN
jgi:hypothetical protein